MRGRSGSSLSTVSELIAINSGMGRSTNTSLPFGPNSP